MNRVQAHQVFYFLHLAAGLQLTLAVCKVVLNSLFRLFFGHLEGCTVCAQVQKFRGVACLQVNCEPGFLLRQQAFFDAFELADVNLV